jgi:glyoxylase-like metal-dependent hydrolase (beta-lactamase superfamily II)
MPVLGVLMAVMLTTAGRDPALQDKYLETIKVSESVYVFKPKIDWTHGNGVAIIGPDGVFFIDTFIQFNYAEEAIRRLRQVTRLPVRYVLNTHWHYDHVMGNSVFKRVFPQAQIIAHDSTAARLVSQVKPRVEGERAFIDGSIATADSEVTSGKIGGVTPIVGSMKPFWALALQEAKEYKQQFRPERFVPADITFSDSLTMRWGSQTLRLIHMAENGHSAGDVVVWIPEARILVAGDIVVGPTPYATYRNSPGLIRALHTLIGMNPAIVIPGHGEVEHDLAYMQLLERAFTEYRRAAEAAYAAKVPVQEALKTIAFPEIDRQFTGDDAMKQFAYRAFFARNLIRNTYQYPPSPSSEAPASR